MAAPLRRVALVGLGNMGVAIAEQLLDAERPLSVFNRTSGRDVALVERGAYRLDSPADALRDADVCLLTLADDAAVEAVACGGDGVLVHARAGTTLVEMSTISVAASARVAAAAAACDVGYLRAPLSGNPGAIRSRKAAIVVSGPADVAERCRPVLDEIASTVRYVGEGERARVLKLVLQILIGGTAELLAEAVVLGEAADVDRKTVLETIAASVVGSAFVEYKTQALVDNDYSATFTTAMMLKDVNLILELAGQAGVELPLTDGLRSVLDATIDAGHAEEDFISVARELERRAATHTKQASR